MNKLSDYTKGRDNNFNLIRMVSALAVLVTHSFALVLGSGEFEPFRKSIGMTMGTIAVDVFFITSGFLVTASLLNRQSIIEFAWARALRIFPALFVMLLLTVFVLGPVFTSLPLSKYFAYGETYAYLLGCSALFTDIARSLPGVFEDNPYKLFINGSLWTLPYEVRMYAALASVWFVLKIVPSSRRSLAFKIMVIALVLLSGANSLVKHFYFFSDRNSLSFLFFTGASFYILKERIRFSHWVFYGMVTVLALSVQDKDLFYVVYSLSIAYILFYLAFIPSRFIRKYNRLGDYSYGVYIYAWPVQQSVVALFPDVTVLDMILISSGVTILLSAASWHLIEKHALSLKIGYVERTRRIFKFSQTKSALPVHDTQTH